MDTPHKIAFASTCFGAVCGLAGLVAGIYLGVVRPSMGPNWVPTATQTGVGALVVVLIAAAVGAGLARLLRTLRGKAPAAGPSDDWH